MNVFRRIKPLSWCAVLILFITPCYFIFVMFDKDSKADEKQEEQLTNKAFSYTEYEPETTRKQSIYPGLQLYSEISDTEEYTVSITYPLTGIKTIDQPIQAWVEEQKQTFLEGVKANQQNDSFPSHLHIQVETNELDDGVYNIVLHAEFYNGGANGTQLVSSFTFDIERESEIQLTDLFKSKEQLLIEIISSELKKEIEQHPSYAEFIQDESFDEYLADIDTWKWGISKDSLTLYFDKYEIGPGSLGSFSLSIPHERLHQHLKERWKKIVEIQEKEQENDEGDQFIEDQLHEEKEQEDDQPNTMNIENYDKFIALTFDDGPQPNVTPGILETLEKYDAVATFFMLGIQVEYYPEIAKLVADQGHEVAAHSISHMDLTLQHKGEVIDDLTKSIQIIENTTGVRPALFRPPFGAYNEQVEEAIAETGLTMILWTVDSLDWKNRNAQSVYTTIMRDIEVGSTVLMHDIHPTTADALPDLLETLSNEGYQFVTVSELLELQKLSGSKSH